MSDRNGDISSTETPRNSMEARLRALLDQDCKANTIVAVRSGKISRRRYADLLGCHQSNMANYKAVFIEYEQRLGVKTGPLRHLVAMRQWLTTAYESGELGVRDGKVDRLAFQTQFGLRSGFFHKRYPALRALFDEFDQRAQREGYLPRSKNDELARLQAALAGQPALNKDRITINEPKLAQRAGIPLFRLQDRPFRDALIARQAEILNEAKASTIDPYIHDRVFAFSPLLKWWPRPFLERISKVFAQIAGTFAYKGARQPYLELVAALRWIGESADPNCRVVVHETIELGRVQSAECWEEALFAYRDHLVAKISNGSAKESRVNGAIQALRSLLNELASGRVVPSTSVPLPGIKYIRRKLSHRLSVAEAGRKKRADYVTFAQQRYLDVCKTSGTELGTGESAGFIEGLAEEIEAFGELPVQPAAAIQLILERRLDALRSRAIEILDTGIAAHRAGGEIIAQTNFDGARFEAAYCGNELNLFEKARLVQKYFPKPDSPNNAHIGQGGANLLALVSQRRGGFLYNARGGFGQYGQFFQRRFFEYGGIEKFARMLNPEADAIGAVLTLYLIESGANLAVGRTLDRDCLEVSDVEGYRRITGHKARAKGKPIIVDLPDTSDAVRGIEWILFAGERLRARAEIDADRLFLMRNGSRVQLMTPNWYTGWFKRLVRSIPALEGFNILPNMIRPSVLLHAALSNDGRLAAGLAIGQHSLAVTQGYQQKWPSRLLYDANIARFQKAFETLVLAGIEDAAVKLGISVEEFEKRLGDLRATGLGTFCKDPRGRPGERGETCSTVDCWNDCPHLLIVAEVEAIASLQLWQASLRDAQPEWERDRPERWDAVWLPWLCLTDVVEEKMVRGPMIKIWNAAKKRSQELALRPGYVPPKPW